MDNVLLFLVVPQIAVSYSLTWAIRVWASRLDLVDIPNDRSSHKIATPRGGGLAVVVTILLSVLVLSVITGLIYNKEILAFLLGGSLIAFVGFLDDRQSLSASKRMAMQALVALVMVWVLGYPPVIQIPVIGVIQIGGLGAVVTVIWIIGFINAYNFMDGIDGIAGGTAIVTAIGWLSLFGISFEPNIVVVVLMISVIGGCIGFLKHNWQPAQIFMGDVGSTFLGFTFAVMPLLLKETQTQSLTSAALLMWPFLFDAVVTFARRLFNGKDVFKAHREHIYQRFVDAGLSHAQVTSIYLVMSTLGIVFASSYLELSRIVMIAPFILGGGMLYVADFLSKNKCQFVPRD